MAAVHFPKPEVVVAVYNKKCVYISAEFDKINFCRFRCVINDGPYTLL